jgi:hypothetical protein
MKKDQKNFLRQLKNNINYNLVGNLCGFAVFGSRIRDVYSGSGIRDKLPGSATLRIGNIFLCCLTLCRRYKDSAHLNVLLISIEQLLGSNHLIITILKVEYLGSSTQFL